MERPGHTPLSEELRRSMIETKVWQPECPVPLERLASVRLKYVDFAGDEHSDGELIVFDAAAHRVSRIFERLFDMRFPLSRLRSIHHYGGNDDASMTDNNCSSFNFRKIPDGQTISIHGYGLAIDINPVQNPFIQFQPDEGIASIHPPEGWQYLNRKNQKPGMVEPIVSVFEENGFFIWGGSWTTPIDYHHFQPPRVVVSLITAMSEPDGVRFFELCIEKRAAVLRVSGDLDTSELIRIYRQDREAFFSSFSKKISSV